MKKYLIFVIMLFVAMTTVSAECDQLDLCEMMQIGQMMGPVMQRISYLENSQPTCDGTVSGGGSGYDRYNLGYDLFGDRDAISSDWKLDVYLDENYVTRAEYEHLRNLLGEWQGKYYNLEMRYAKLEQRLYGLEMYVDMALSLK